MAVDSSSLEDLDFRNGKGGCAFRWRGRIGDCTHALIDVVELVHYNGDELLHPVHTKSV